MMRIILLRHGEVVSPPEKSYIGSTELSLSDRGRQSVRALLPDLRTQEITALYTSPQGRCLECAELIGKELNLPLQIRPELREIELGEWEGVPIRTIRENFPEAYRERGEHLGSYRAPGGESFGDVSERAGRVIDELASQQGTALVVTHAGVIRSLLCRVRGISCDAVLSFSIPYASCTELLGTDGGYHAKKIGVRSLNQLDEADIERLYRKYAVPDNVIRHMQKVSAVCEELLANLPPVYNRERVTKAALLHDLLRTQPEHALRSAEVLEKEGYPEVAALVRLHHDGQFDEAEPLTEAEILYYADKLVQEDRVVDLEARFAKSREKCRTPEALENHARQYRKAVGIRNKLKQQA